ncbi:MAG: glycosyltransferase family 2 protein [bacterium]|nr:glycosyltransferase family 2 protein [bacterium]
MTASENKRLTISIIIPVLNEMNAINSIIDALTELKEDQDIEIIVADGCPEGSTAQVIQHREVKKILSPKGRARQMNTGAHAAAGDILLFLHADTQLPQGAFSDIEEVMRPGNYVAGSFDLGLDNNRLVYRLTGFLGSIKHRLTRVPFGDQAIFINKNYFHEIGGYSPIPLMEDIDLMKKIKQRKDRIYIIPKQVRTSSRKWEKEGTWHTIFKNWTIEALYLFGASPERLVKHYYKGWKNE